MFIMSLAIADLIVGVIVMPISAAYAITGKIYCHSAFNFGRASQLQNLILPCKAPRITLLLLMSLC